MSPDGPVLQCGSCDSGDLFPVLDLGMQPLPQARPGRDTSGLYPLRLVQCPQCTLVQLDYIVPHRDLFPDDYPYATGNTKALRDHFTRQARDIAAMVEHDELVVDIGANDGTMLKNLNVTWRRDNGGIVRPRVLAVEPTDQVKKASAAGVEVVQDYFTAELGAKLRGLYGPAKVIVTSNTFGHIPDPHDFLEGVTTLLDFGGTFIIENQDWHNVVNDLQIDTIYHEHLRYYTPASLSYLLAKHGLQISSLNRIDMHGGSFRAVCRTEEPHLGYRVNELLIRLHELMNEAARDGHIYAIGAPTRATPLVNYAGLGQYLTCACEVKGSEKIGADIPGTGVPIVDEEQLFEDQPPHALLLAWDLETTVVPVLRRKGYTGKIIIPLPEPRVI